MLSQLILSAQNIINNYTSSNTSNDISSNMNTTTKTTPIYNWGWISDEYADMIVSFLPMIVGFIVFYFMVIKPQNDKQEKEEMEKQKRIDNLTAGDTVILNCGIKGTVEKTGAKFILISIALKTVVEVDKSYIQTVEK